MAPVSFGSFLCPFFFFFFFLGGGVGSGWGGGVGSFGGSYTFVGMESHSASKSSTVLFLTDFLCFGFFLTALPKSSMITQVKFLTKDNKSIILN
eukprot:144817_1